MLTGSKGWTASIETDVLQIQAKILSDPPV